MVTAPCVSRTAASPATPPWASAGSTRRRQSSVPISENILAHRPVNVAQLALARVPSSGGSCSPTAHPVFTSGKPSRARVRR